MHDTITDQHFIDNLKKTLAILHLVDGLVVKYQLDKVLILKVMPDFHALPNEFAKLHSTNVITKKGRIPSHACEEAIPVYVWRGT